jgi:NTP pyrophosphatase (non-canonical NTP hydrolase)
MKMMDDGFKIPEGVASRGITDLKGTDFIAAFSLNELAYLCHANAEEKGFWEDVNIKDRRHVLSLLALITTETSEAVEAVRKDDPANFAEELADIMIRVFDVAGGLDVNIGRAVLDKMEKNRGRSFKHGKTC